jgi:hypothetical protein
MLRRRGRRQQQPGLSGAANTHSMSDSNTTRSVTMDKTPEKPSYKWGPERMALLTGTLKKRHSPYPDPSQRRQNRTPGPVNESMQSLASLPATRAVLSAMSAVQSPANPLLNRTQSSIGGNFNISIKRAAIDWKLANKEAEVFKLKADIQKLESVISDRCHNEQELKIQHEKEVAKLEVERQSLTSKIRLLEQEVASCKSEIEALRQSETQLQTAFLPEKEKLEKAIVELKVGDCDLRAKLLDAEEEMKSAKLSYEQDRLKMGHEIKCLNLELDSLRIEKQLLEESNRNHKKELSEMASLREELHRLQSENKSLASSMKQYDESAELRRLFQEDMDELKRLRQENADLKERLSVPLVQVHEQEVADSRSGDDEPDLLHHAVAGLGDDLMSEDDDDGSRSDVRSDSPIPLQVHEHQISDEEEGDDDEDEDNEEEFVECDGSDSPGSEGSGNSSSDIAEISSD